MTDGFTDPQGAEEPGLELISEEGGALLEADVDVSCEDCSHRGVCAAYKGFSTLMDGWKDEMGSEQPIEDDNLALICGAYIDGGDGDE